MGWNLSNSENKKCGKCGMKEDASKKGCCKDEHKQLKIDADQQKSTVASFVDFIYPPIILSPNYSYYFQFNRFEKVTAIHIHPPPLFSIQKMNILYCSFLI